MAKGYLYLETGEVFEGDWIGAASEITGEVVFNTSMTGFEELLKDPGHAGQILTFTYPSVGSSGIREMNSAVHAGAVIAGELSEAPSDYQTSFTVFDLLHSANVPGLYNVDTRSLTETIRKHGTVTGKIVKEKAVPAGEWNLPNSLDLLQTVTVKSKATYGDGDIHLVLIDYGYKQALLDEILEQNFQVTVVPYNTTFEAIQLLSPDGILLSSGPGNPLEMTSLLPNIKKLAKAYPALAIGLGHQLVAAAFGARIEKMPVGHRGGNYPIKDVQTNKVWMTAQSHGYEVKEETLPEELAVRYRNVNDQSVEGLQHTTLPVETVQFHPEAEPGPQDTVYIFEQFYKQLAARGKKYVNV